MAVDALTESSNSHPIAEREYRALTAGAGYRILDDRIVVRFTGDDRASFLHGMCTNDIKGLRPGSLLYALFLTEHAHAIADGFVWATNDALLIEADRESWPRTRTHLEKLLVADDVEIAEDDGLAVIDVEGPAASEILRRMVSGAAPEPWRYVRAGEALIGNVARVGAAGFTILAPRHPRGASEDAIAAGLGAAIAVGAEALDTVRIENGIAKVGVDTNDKTIALEARFESGISFNKGCYLGQETIERATARGGLKKRLFGLRFEGSRVPALDAAILLDGKEVGHVTSAALSPRFGAIGLSILHHSAWTSGTRVEVRDGSNGVGAVVSDLPFK
jgi:folate-binding protein YgfZ